MTNKFIYQLAVVVFITLTAFQCEKDYPIVNKIEVLDDFNISIIEEQTEYKVGDTIWLSAQISEADLLNDSGLEYLKNGFGSFPFEILKLRKYFIQVGAGDFDLIYPNGDTLVYDANGYFLNPRTYVTRIADMEYKNQIYSLKIGLIPTTAADYCFYLDFPTTINFGDFHEELYKFTMINQQFTVKNNNLKLISEYGYSDRIWVGNTDTKYSVPLDDSTRLYAFRVVD